LTCGSGGPSAGDCQPRTTWWATDDVRNLDYPSTNMIVGVASDGQSQQQQAAAAAGSTVPIQPAVRKLATVGPRG
jgi:hypothetical protein